MKVVWKVPLAWHVAYALLLATPAVVMSAVELTDFDDDVMRAMDDAYKDLEPVLGASNTDAAKQDIGVLKDGYLWTTDYFSIERGAPDAAGITADGLKIIERIEKAVAAGDFATAVTGSRDLQANCKSCHDKYKPKKQ